MIWGHYYPHQPILLITELTGFKPVSLLSLSHIPHGQCLQKLTERFPLRLVLKLTSAIPFLSSWSEGQRREAHTHTHRDLRWSSEAAQSSFSPPVGAVHHQWYYWQSGNSQHCSWPAHYCHWGNWADSGCRHWGTLSYDRCDAEVEGGTASLFPKAFLQPFCWRWQNQRGVCAPAEGISTSNCPCESHPL